MMANENINSSAEGTDTTVNSPTTETDEEQTSEETQNSETKETPEAEAEEKIDWQKRYLDTQTALTKATQQISDFGKTATESARTQDWQKFQDEQKQRLDVGTYMKKYTDADGKPTDVGGALNEWMQAREDNINQRVQSMIGPVSNQAQYLQWSLGKMLKEVNPQAYEKQMSLEKKIKGLYEEMPALKNAPDSISLAEQIILSKSSKKDRDTLVKDAIKQGKKSAQQQQGVSISPTNAPIKSGPTTKEDKYKAYLLGKGTHSTVL